MAKLFSAVVLGRIEKVVEAGQIDTQFGNRRGQGLDKDVWPAESFIYCLQFRLCEARPGAVDGFISEWPMVTGLEADSEAQVTT